MATNKLTRITQKIFASEAPADQLVEFGTAKTGTPVISSDVETLQSNPAYTQGYQDAVLSDYAPFLPETNSLHYIETRQLAYLFQHGLAEWDANTVYYKDVSFCSYKGFIYKSLTDDNIGLEPDLYPQNWVGWGNNKDIKWGDITGDITSQTDLQSALALKTDEAQAAHAAMPSNRRVELTLGESGAEYIAPADGYISFSKAFAQGDIGAASISNQTCGLQQGGTAVMYNNASMTIPVKKGDVFKVWYNVTGKTNFFRFVYAEGAQ